MSNEKTEKVEKVETAIGVGRAEKIGAATLAAEKAERAAGAATTAEKSEEAQKKEPTPLERNQILREAVSFYLRNNYITGETLEVCEEFIAGVDEESRVASKVQGARQREAERQQAEQRIHEDRELERLEGERREGERHPTVSHLKRP